MAVTKQVPAAGLEERDHARDCPAKRTESYVERKPDGTPVVINRCIDCGGHRAEEMRR